MAIMTKRSETTEGMTMRAERNTEIQVRAIWYACATEQWHRKQERGRWFDPKRNRAELNDRRTAVFRDLWLFPGGIRAQRRGLGVSMLSTRTGVPDGCASWLDSVRLVGGPWLVDGGRGGGLRDGWIGLG